MSNKRAGPADYSWAYDTSAIDWEELSGLYRITRSAKSHLGGRAIAQIS